MDQEILRQCPICERTALDSYIICKDYLVSQKEFSIQSCQKCGFRFTNPRPNAASIGAYYESVNYVSHNDQSGGLINTLYKWIRRYTLQQKLKLINSIHPQKGKILDVGCGTGLFLETCQQGGWEIKGVEPDDSAREVAMKRLNLSLQKTVEQVGEGSFELITLWHVLEHIADLKATINELRIRLKKGGTLLLALPNSDSLDARHFEQYWAAYDLPRHLSHFTPKTINSLLSQEGFQLVNTHPMYFDAFYIGMLSTRYRDGQTDWFESIVQGIRSNRSGNKTGNYSSLIYTFQKTA